MSNKIMTEKEILEEGLFDRLRIRRSIKAHTPIHFYYTSKEEKGSHKRNIVYPVVLGQKNGKYYIRAYIVSGFSYSYGGDLSGLPDYSDRKERWRIYDVSKMKKTRRIKVKPDQIMDISDFPEYNPDDSFFDKINIAMKDDKPLTDVEPAEDEFSFTQYKPEPKRRKITEPSPAKEVIEFTSDQYNEPLVPADEIQEAEEIPEREDDEPLVDTDEIPDDQLEEETEEEEIGELEDLEESLSIQVIVDDSMDCLYKMEKNILFVNENFKNRLHLYDLSELKKLIKEKMNK